MARLEISNFYPERVKPTPAIFAQGWLDDDGNFFHSEGDSWIAVRYAFVRFGEETEDHADNRRRSFFCYDSEKVAAGPLGEHGTAALAIHEKRLRSQPPLGLPFVMLCLAVMVARGAGDPAWDEYLKRLGVAFYAPNPHEMDDREMMWKQDVSESLRLQSVIEPESFVYLRHAGQAFCTEDAWKMYAARFVPECTPTAAGGGILAGLVKE